MNIIKKVCWDNFVFKFLNFFMTIESSNNSAVLARGIGRRKEAVAQVQLMEGKGEFMINGKTAQDYLQQNSCSILSIKAPFDILQNMENVLKMEQITTVVKVEGGGLTGQSEAIKLGVARALAQLTENAPESNVEARKALKDKGYLTQDARIKERRKYGLKKARKASQYHKR